MVEIVINLHIHTHYSDGSGSHKEIAQAALRCGLDAVLVTDHNVYVHGQEGYYRNGDKQVLLLVGEEIHDPNRDPQKSHLLVFGADEELAHLGYDLNRLVKNIQDRNALAFAAHPIDIAAPLVGEGDLSWEDWQVQGITGLELWNGFSEFKARLKSWPRAFYYVHFPDRVPQGPFQGVLDKWDEMLASGQRLAVIGGSDAHALHIRKGPFRRIVFPYDYHFRAINTHLLLAQPLTGSLSTDKKAIYEAMRDGRGFVANDLPASSRGFSFTASGYNRKVTMGDQISAAQGVTFQVRLPAPAETRLVCGGQTVYTWYGQTSCTHITSQPGAYRIEARLPFKGRQVGWIFSNPIFVRA